MACVRLYRAHMNCWGAFLFWHSSITGRGSRLLPKSFQVYQKAGCFSPKKSQPMLLDVNPAQHFQEFFRQPCKINSSLLRPSIRSPSSPLPRPLSLSLFLSKSLTRRLTGGIRRDEREAFETSVWETRREICGEWDVSVSSHIHHRETTDDAEERITRAITLGGRAGWTCGGVTLEPEYMRGGSRGVIGRECELAFSSHVPSFLNCAFVCPLPQPPPRQTSDSCPPPSLSTCRDPVT